MKKEKFGEQIEWIWIIGSRKFKERLEKEMIEYGKKIAKSIK